MDLSLCRTLLMGETLHDPSENSVPGIRLGDPVTHGFDCGNRHDQCTHSKVGHQVQSQKGRGR